MLSLLLLLGASGASAQQRFGVTIIYDGPGDRLADTRRAYIEELLALTENEFDVRLRPFTADWTD